MRYTLRSKLSLSYIFMALLLIGVLIAATNFLLEKQFQSYRVQQIKQNNQELATALGQQYQAQTGTWTLPVVESIGVGALERGLILKVNSVGGETIWDATVHNHGLCVQMINHMTSNMTSRYPYFEGGYMENTYAIESNGVKVGSVQIGYYGPFYLSDNDLAFINTLNSIILSVGVLSLFLALVLGAFMSGRLTRPISRVINTAQQISKGFYGDRVAVKTNTTEIIQLTSTINGLAESLQNQEGLRRRLTSDVAHELRTPLATLQSHMEAMIDGVWEADTERLKSCHEEILRINRMVGDLEKLARFESENLQLSKTSFDLHDHISTVMTSMETDFVNKGVQLTLEGEQTDILADKDKLSQVIINLLTNALKFTEQGGAVCIHLKGNAETVTIVVADTGIGISDEDLPFIFDRFFRADPSRNRMTGGSGIGLAIVKAIVTAHGGHVAVQSKLGEGTAIKVMLPRSLN